MPMPRTPLLAILLVASVGTAGCTWFGAAEESNADVDDGGYVAGPGVSLAAQNDADLPFTVQWTVLDQRGNVLRTVDAYLEPGERAVRLMPLERGPHTVRMTYNWTGAGTSASGSDAQPFDSAECAHLSALSWRLLRDGDVTGSQFLGKRCAEPDER